MHDIRLAFRRLRQHSTFTVVAGVTLAVGIGANTTVFSLLNYVMLRPLPGIERPERLVTLTNSIFDGLATHSYPNYEDFRDRTDVFSDLAGFGITPMNFNRNGQNARVWGHTATGNYFRTLGVQAAIGRVFGPEDDRQPGAHPVAVLSHACWQNRFGGDPAAVGEPIRLNGLPYTVVGVLPPGFSGTELWYTPEIWVPVMMQAQINPGDAWLESRGRHDLFVVGRLADGVSEQQAEAAVNAVATDLGSEFPQEVEGLRVSIAKPGLLGNTIRGPVTGFTVVLLGVGALVLLIACTNLAGILLARASDRRRETAVRLALGARRSDLVRQLLAESLLLSVAGGLGGRLIAMWGTDLLSGYRLPVGLPLAVDLAIDWRVAAFILAISMVTAFLFGLFPALKSTRPQLVDALRHTVSTGRSPRWQHREVLVAVQIGLGVVIITGCLISIRSLDHALEMNIGFDPRDAVAVSMDLDLQGYDQDTGPAFQRRLLEQVRSIAGIKSAAIVNTIPLGLNRALHSVRIEGTPELPPAERPTIVTYRITPGYLDTMKTKLIRGRDVSARDTRTAKPVALINEAFARQLLPEPQALGARFRLGGDEQWVEIVGIVETGRYISLGESSRPALFLPLDQQPSLTTTLVVRSALPESQTVDLLRGAIASLDPELPLYRTGGLQQHLDVQMLGPRVASALLFAFALIAVVLVATGLYGLMIYSVARRTREIGIRMAVGASGAWVLRAVIGRGAILLAAGSAFGLAGALALSGFLSAVLFGVDSHDPFLYAGAVGVMAVVTALACLLPGRRAMSIQPAAALRQE
jgi:predicted permease